MRATFGIWLFVVCLLSAFAGCSSDDEGGTASNTGTGAKPAAGGSGGSIDGGGTGGGIDLDGSSQPLVVEPATATLSVTDKSNKPSQQFKATVGGAQVAASWTLSSYDVAAVDSTGLATATGIIGGKVTLTATYGGKTGTAELTVDVKLSEDVDANVDPANKAALGGAPMPDPGPDPTKFLYPYNKTVMPRGLLSPLVMVSPGSIPPASAKITLSGALFSWQGYYQIKDPAKPQLTVPQDVWNAALATTAGGKLGIEVVKASGGQAFGPYAIEITVAKGSLKGVVYYMTYQSPQNGIWSVRPGDQAAAKQVKPGCVVCHSVAASGTMLSTGAEVSQQSAESGVYQVDLAGNATQISQSPPGLGGDSRGLSFGAWTPDGKYVTRSQSDFWGGVDQMAWKVDVAGKKLDQANVVGLGPNVSAYVPTFSPDGKHFAFTQGNGETSPPGSAIRSIDVMDVSVDESAGPAGTLTFTNRKVVLDNGAAGRVTKFVTFLPDSTLIVLQESVKFDPAHGGMLPSRDASGTYGAADGRLYFVDTASSTHVELKSANTGNVASDEDHNYEPFALPIPAGGYFWVVFTSIREYGNEYQGSAVRKQLWVAAISPGASGGADPAHPPFFLPNQTSTKNERGFWALDPCKPKGQGCETGDECCDGFCRPSDPNDPTSPKACSEGSGCSQVSEKCTTNADCCAIATGVECLGGFCSPQPPQ